jgi:hypothetical protein
MSRTDEIAQAIVDNIDINKREHIMIIHTQFEPSDDNSERAAITTTCGSIFQGPEEINAKLCKKILIRAAGIVSEDDNFEENFRVAEESNEEPKIPESTERVFMDLMDRVAGDKK